MGRLKRLGKLVGLVIIVLVSSLFLGLASFSFNAFLLFAFFALIFGSAWLAPKNVKTSTNNALVGWKYKLGLTDTQIFLLISGLMVLGFTLPYVMTFHLNPYVQDYKLVINLASDSARINETLVYNVPNPEGHEFWRSYYKIGPMKDMKVDSITCPKGFKPKIYKKTDRVELACRNDRGIKPGTYQVTFSYTIPKPYICYQSLCFFDWNVLTDFSLPIDNGQVKVKGAKKVWGYPPLDSNFSLSPRMLLEVKAIKPKSEVTGVWKNVNKPDSAIFEKEGEVYFAGFLYKNQFLIGLGIIGLAILGLFLIYLKFGREEKIYGVPDVLHTLPSDRKPYDVNRIVYGDPNRIEPEGIQATLLDLARRGWLEIKGSKIKFKQGRDELNDYEREVYETYKWLAEGKDKLDMEEVQERITEHFDDVSFLKKIKDKFDNLTKPKGEIVFDFKGKFFGVLWLLIIMSLIHITGLSFLPNPAKLRIFFSLWIGILGIALIDSYCFGRFKKDVYKEILMWRAFARLLEDYSLIKKYAPQDILMWGKWLVYATALGKADNVIKVMKEFNIQVPNLDYDGIYYAYPAVYVTASDRYSVLTTPGSGGGFGGGFGGGGGGIR